MGIGDILSGQDLTPRQIGIIIIVWLLVVIVISVLLLVFTRLSV